MNKSLENEYKELMKHDVPDLWARIEAGLEPKEDASFTNSTVENKGAQKQFNNKFRMRFRVWGTVAAACVCVAVVIPVLFNGGAMRDNVSGSSDTADGAAFDTAYDAVSAESVQEAAYNEEAVEIRQEDEAENSAVVTASEDLGDYDLAEEMPGIEMADTESACVYRVTVTILEIAESPENVIYTARVENSDDGALLAGTEITIYDSLPVDCVLERDAEYQLNLLPVENEAGEIRFFQKSP